VAVNTNDAFVGIDSDMIGTTKVFPPAFDAGKLFITWRDARVLCYDSGVGYFAYTTYIVVED